MATKEPTTRTPVRRSAMHYKHLALGATMEERDGWQQAARYTSAASELQCLRESVGLCDISPAAKLVFKGENLESALSGTFTGAAGISVGEVRRVQGFASGSQTAITLARLADDEYLALGPAGQAPTLADGFREKADACAHIVDLTSGLAGMAIIGPRACSLLSHISELDTSDREFLDLTCAQSKFADIHGILLRVDQGELPAFQLYFPREFGEYLWDVLMEAAVRCGGGPVGFEAMSLR